MPADAAVAGPVALVLAGGGARGAYEAGALAALLPVLDARGERPTLLVGTSVGALNAAWLAAHADLPAAEVARRAVEVWGTIGFGDVLRPLVTARGTGRLVRHLVRAPFGRGRLDALLDPAPLPATIERVVPFDRLAANVAAGRVTVAVAATSVRTGRTVLFVATAGDVPGPDRVRGIEYVRVARLGVEHILASAAIPAAFPAVRVAGEWYVDGGTRMNAPTKPALVLGAGRLVLVGLNGTDPDESEPAGDGPPDVFEGAAHLIQGLLADPLAADVRTLAAMNALLLAADGSVDGKTPKPYVFVAPPRRDSLGELARAVYLEHFDRLPLLPGRSLELLGRLVGAGRSDIHGELFSYLAFSPELAAALIAHGREDAGRWLATDHDDGPWRVGRLPGEPPAPRLTPV